MRVLFAGGGTGGHVMPGLATAEALDRLVPDAQYLFLGTERDRRMGYADRLRQVPSECIPGARWRGLTGAHRFAVRSADGLVQTLRVFRRFRPHVVVGLGGYSCVAPVMVAGLLGVPVMLFEANARPGRAVRLLGPHVRCVQTQWTEVTERLPAANVVEDGLPVRGRIFGGSRVGAMSRFDLAPDRFTLLVMGGSQGALPLNRIVLDVLEGLPAEQAGKLQVLHLAGPEKLDEVRGRELPDRLIHRPVGYLAEMEQAYAAADLVVCRAGGSTLAELSALGLPSVLVPYPHAADDHQHANAEALGRAGGAIQLEQGDGSRRSLARIMSDALQDPEKCRSMGRRARQVGRPDAARAAVEQICRLAGRPLKMSAEPQESPDEGTLSSAA
jgi:UDP-N-acetylglucosamine--N-acetylmuramyl-(pentapeptide) pyrophosphoryl-undecaprenol N-acetylglucosamine transferase